jgi:curved DNA-binding protein CbpA
MSISAGRTSGAAWSGNADRANLAGTSLVAADLCCRMPISSGAKLSHANLDRPISRMSGSTLRRCPARSCTTPQPAAQLDSAAGDEHTALPPGLAMPGGWQRRLAKRPREERSGKPGDPRSVLGVGRWASRRAIRKAYLRLAKELHPDGRVEDPIAAERMKEINDAYQELKGFGGRAEAKRSDARRARTVFLVGALTSSAPVLLAALAWFYYAGFFGGETEIAQQVPDSATTSSVAKQPQGAGKERETAWAEAERAGTREAWQRFVEAYPDGNRAAKARQAIAAIDAAEARQRAEHTAWAAAEKSGTREDWQRYLDAHPYGERAVKARQAIAAIDAEARQRADRAAWAAAEKSATKEGWQRYLDAHPYGNHAVKARRLPPSTPPSRAARRLPPDRRGEGTTRNGSATISPRRGPLRRPGRRAAIDAGARRRAGLPPGPPRRRVQPRRAGSAA